MRPIQFIGIFIGSYLLYKSYLSFKGENEDIEGLLTWLALGGSIFVVSINLNLLNYLSEFLNMKKNPYTIFTISILILFVLIFKLYLRLEKISKQISRLNREVSLQGYQQDEKIAVEQDE